MTSKSPAFFNELNELRAIAALGVVFHHIELYKSRDNIASLYDLKIFAHFISVIGKYGVYLFFVLSGFLITYLLLKEKDASQKINIKNFYLRRVFRIWPLYYFIVFISFLIVPMIANSLEWYQLDSFYYRLISDSSNYSFLSIILFILFLPNVALLFGIKVVGASQTWSVGVEEQFYLFWPHIVRSFDKKYLYFIFSTIFLILFSLKVFNIPYLSKILSQFPFEFMAIGSLGALVYKHNHTNILTKINNIYAQTLTLLTISFLLFVKLFPYVLQTTIIGVLFLVLILQTINDNNKLSLRNKKMSFLGVISYGSIYMYHPFVMFLIFPISNQIFLDQNSIEYNLFIYFSIVFLTIVLSYFSYQYFEKYFIILKDTKYKSI